MSPIAATAIDGKLDDAENKSNDVNNKNDDGGKVGEKKSAEEKKVGEKNNDTDKNNSNNNKNNNNSSSNNNNITKTAEDIELEEGSLRLQQCLTSVFREVVCDGRNHPLCVSCACVFAHIIDHMGKETYSHRVVARAIKLSFPNCRRLQIDDKEKTRIFCGMGFHLKSSSSHEDLTDMKDKLMATFEMWKTVEDPDKKEKLKREMQQLVFHNPGPSNKDLLHGFRPEMSNREKRKLNRLLDDKIGVEKKEKAKKTTVHDEKGALISSGEDLCDCLIKDCPGCHFPCPKCKSEKCGSTCRCNRKWTYDYVYVDPK